MQHFDVIVVGTGAMGSAALWQLAERGKSRPGGLRVLGIDRFPPGHDRGSSHGQTRMIRQAYFEHPDYVPLVLAAYDQWRTIADRAGRELYRETGLLQIGPADGEVVPGVLASAERHGLNVESLRPADIARRYPAFRVDAPLVGVFEPRAGYLHVEACIVAMAQQALAAGVQLHCGESVMSWSSEGSSVVIRTNRDTYHAGHVIFAAGAWSDRLLCELGGKLTVLRKPQYWFRTSAESVRVERGCPAWLYEVEGGIFYGFPQLDERGMKLAEHSGGTVVPDPLTVDRALNATPDSQRDLQRVEQFVSKYLPGVSTECSAHAICMYTMTSDHHFYVDRHPECAQVSFAAGLSGHGFKFAPVLGQALVELALDGKSTLPVGFLGLSRSAYKL